MAQMSYRNIQQFEFENYGSHYRKCAIVDIKGNSLNCEINDLHYYYKFSDADLKKMKGNILVYNDTDFYSLFAKDMIEIACNNQLKELRLVTEFGTFSLLLTSVNWPSYDAIINAFDSTASEYLPLIEEHIEPWEQKYNIWKKVTKKLGLKIQRLPPNSRIKIFCEKCTDN